MLLMPTDSIGTKHHVLAEDETLSQELREASRGVIEAHELLLQDRSDESARRAKEAYALFLQLDDKTGVSDALRVLMCALAEDEQREEAIQLGKEELQKAQAAGRKEDEAILMHSLCEVSTFRCRGAYKDQSMTWAEKAIAIYKELEDRKSEAFGNLALASACIQRSVKAHQRKHFMKGHKALKAALEIFGAFQAEDMDARAGEARALHGLASVTGRLEEFPKAVAYSREAAALWQMVGNRKMEALELEFLARLQLQLGQLKDGRRSAEESLRILLSLKGASAYQGIAIRTTVKALLRGEKVKEAKKLVKRRQDVFQEAGDTVGMVAALDALAEVSMAESNAAKAVDLLEEAVAMARKTKTKPRQLAKFQATMVAEQANFWLQGQKPEDALEYAMRSNKMFKEMGCEVEMATTLSTMVMSHLCMDNVHSALEDTRRAIDIYKMIDDRKGEGLAWINYCSALTKAGDIDEAVKIAMKARDLFASQKLLIGEGQSLDHLSSLHMSRGEFHKSATCAKRGKSLFREASCRRQEAFMAWAESEALFGLAQMQEEANQKQTEQIYEISDMSQKALEAASDAVQLCRKAKDELLILHALQALAKTLILCMQHEEAVPCIDEAMAMATRMDHGLEIANLQLLKAQIGLCEGNEEEAKAMATKAKELFLENGNEQGAEQAQEIIDMNMKQDEDVHGIYSNGPGGPLQAMPDMPNAQQAGGFRPGGMQRPPPRMGGGGGDAPPPGPAAVSQAEPAGAVSKTKGPSLEQIMEQVADIASSLIGSDDLAGDTPLMDAGLDSLASVEFQNTLQKDFRGVSMPSTMMFDFPTTKEIAAYIADSYK